MSSGEGEVVTKISRRKFLTIVGQGTAVGAAATTLSGCADPVEQKIFPFVKGENEQIPGVAVWYRSTCQECSAGCGIQVRTREGRAVKIEGNPEHPINRGGLCALGQSALQGLYDPDRVRQPLSPRRESDAIGNSSFSYTPIAWDEALTKVSSRLTEEGKRKLLITGEVSGLEASVCRDFCEAFGVEHVVIDHLSPVVLSEATGIVFGTPGIPTYELDKADVVLNFGADFLESFVSPVEYARKWATTRRTKKPVRVIQVEPRLSLTGANADTWLAPMPGREVVVARYVLAALLELGRGKDIRPEVRADLVAAVRGLTIEEAVRNSGIDKEKLLKVVRQLADAKHPLVMVGGTAALSADALQLAVTVQAINLILGAAGDTLLLGAMRQPRASLATIDEITKAMERGEVGLLLVHGANPVYSLPAAYGFHFAIRKVSTVATLSTLIDETAQLSDVILPTHHALEDWRYTSVVPGVHSLTQPSMRPLYDSRSFAEIVVQLASKGGKELRPNQASSLDMVRTEWQQVHAASGSSLAFEPFWRQTLEQGGFVDETLLSKRVPVRVSARVREIIGASPTTVVASGAAHANDTVTVLPFPSIKSFDGRAANRPWLQELPDPISTSVWEAWAEVHPKTAESLGVTRDDGIILRTDFGEVRVPVLVTEYIREGLVAVPMGFGHAALGRYANQAPHGNILSLLNATVVSGALAFVSTKVATKKVRGRMQVVSTQGSDTQLGRGIARTATVTAAGELVSQYKDPSHASGSYYSLKSEGHEAHDAHGGEGKNAAHGGGHEVKQMYEQREHPLYQWGMAVDLSACTGCSACVVACYAENNIPVVGKEQVRKGREMAWLQIQRYHDGSAEELQVSFIPMMCQHCQNAPCEPVCPVYATYHNEEGLNAMVYNRCVGTRYCSNNCSYKVRRFNWFEYDLPEPMQWQLNPDVTKRGMGVMEKCTFCVQRINEAKNHAKDEGRLVKDGEVQPACVQSCPTSALVFGNLKDPNSRVSQLAKDKRSYKVVDSYINTQPSVTYLERIRWEQA